MGPKEQLTVTAGNITTYIYSLWPYCCSSTILLDFGFSVGNRITSYLACTAFKLYFPSITTQINNQRTAQWDQASANKLVGTAELGIFTGLFTA